MASKEDVPVILIHVEEMALMGQHPKPDDFVIATGQTICLNEFVEAALSLWLVGLDRRQQGG